MVHCLVYPKSHACARFPDGNPNPLPDRVPYHPGRGYAFHLHCALRDFPGSYKDYRQNVDAIMQYSRELQGLCSSLQSHLVDRNGNIDPFITTVVSRFEEQCNTPGVGKSASKATSGLRGNTLASVPPEQRETVQQALKYVVNHLRGLILLYTESKRALELATSSVVPDVDALNDKITEPLFSLHETFKLLNRYPDPEWNYRPCYCSWFGRQELFREKNELAYARARILDDVEYLKTKVSPAISQLECELEMCDASLAKAALRESESPEDLIPFISSGGFMEHVKPLPNPFDRQEDSAHGKWSLAKCRSLGRALVPEIGDSPPAFTMWPTPFNPFMDPWVELSDFKWKCGNHEHTAQNEDGDDEIGW